MDDKLSSIIKEFPEYLFDSINSAKLEARKSGKDDVDLGYGNPDIPSHPLVVEKLIESARLTKNHKYSVSRGIQGLRNAIAEKYSRSYDVSLDPEKNIVNTIGSKEGLTHLMFSIINPGDKVIIPDPSYPIHQYAPLISRAKVKKVQLKDTNEFLESIEKITSTEDIKLVLISVDYLKKMI